VHFFNPQSDPRPPLSMMSLVSCRNLLIYMNPELQSRIIPIFHYSLIPGGMLFARQLRVRRAASGFVRDRR